MKSLLFKILKFAVSGAIIFWLFYSVDLVALREQLGSIDWQWFVYANLLTIGWLVSGTWRWQILLKVNHLRIEFPTLVKFSLIGHFFSNFLPSNVGGDIAKAMLVARRCGLEFWPHAASSVFVARVLGLFGLFLVLILGVVLNIEWVFSLNVQIPLLLAFIGLLVLSIFIFSDVGNAILRRFESVRIAGVILGIVRRLHDSILSYRSTPQSLLWGFLLSGLLSLIVAVQVWMLIQMFPGNNIGWTSQIVVFVLTSLTAMIPITINGYGLQEGMITVLLVSLGMEPSQGLLVALAYRMLSLIAGSVGGILFALDGVPISSASS